MIHNEIYIFIIGFIIVLGIIEFIVLQIIFAIDRHREEKRSFRDTIDCIDEKMSKVAKELNCKCNEINEQINKNTKEINSVIDKIDRIKYD